MNHISTLQAQAYSGASRFPACEGYSQISYYRKISKTMMNWNYVTMEENTSKELMYSDRILEVKENNTFNNIYI